MLCMIEIFDLRSPFRFEICILSLVYSGMHKCVIYSSNWSNKNNFFFQFNSVFFCTQNVTQVFDYIFSLGESSNFRFVTCCELSEIHLILKLIFTEKTIRRGHQGLNSRKHLHINGKCIIVTEVAYTCNNNLR